MTFKANRMRVANPDGLNAVTVTAIPNDGEISLIRFDCDREQLRGIKQQQCTTLLLCAENTGNQQKMGLAEKEQSHETRSTNGTSKCHSRQAPTRIHNECREIYSTTR